MSCNCIALRTPLFALALLGMTSPALADTQSFKYDALGRLVEVSTPYETLSVYSYDAANNRTQVVRPEVNSYAAQIYRLYDIVLGRAPTSSELGIWLPHFETGGTLVAAATGILTDGSVQSRWGMPISDTSYITKLYQYAFRRSPTQAEIDIWLQLLSSSDTRGTMLAVFVQHADHRVFTDGTIAQGLQVTTTDANSYAAQIYRLYHLMLGRTPAPGEIHGWIKGCLGAGLTLDNCAGGFLADPSVQARWGASLSDRQFVEKVYLFGFGREADEGEKNYWTSCLSNGWTRQAIAAFFSDYIDHRNITDSVFAGAGYTYIY